MKVQRISSAERLYLCPGSAVAQDGIEYARDEESRNTAAMSGTKVHAAVHMLLAGASIDFLPINRREEWVANTFADIVRRKEAQIGVPATMILPEMECYIRNNWIGHWDRVVIFGDNLTLLWEWKTGRLSQEKANAHVQGRMYGVAIYDTIPTAPYPLNACVLSAGEEFGEMLSECVFDKKAIEAARAEADYITERVSLPDAPRVPGLRQCKYCRAKGTPRCPETAQMLETAATQFTSEAVGDIHLIGDALRTWKWVRPYGENVERVVRGLLDKGEKVLTSDSKEWVFGKARQSRTVEDLAIAFGKLKGITDALEFLSACKLSLGDLEDVIYRKAPAPDIVTAWVAAKGKKKLTRDLANKFVMEVLAELVVMQQNRPPLELAGVAEEESPDDPGEGG